MHQSVIDFGRRQLAGRHWGYVLEVGSLNVNGSLRECVTSYTYTGIDITPGPGVDVVCDVTAFELDREPSYDLVVSTEMLEHAPDWRAAVSQMKRLLVNGGKILLTTRSIGFARHHEHPGDFWRFSVEDMRRIFADFEIEEASEDPGGSGGGPGALLMAKKPGRWVPCDLSQIHVYSMELE